VLIVGGAAAYGASQLLSDDPPSRDQAPSDPDPAPSGGNDRTVDPATVTVSVLNGTTVQGLAAQIGDQVEAGGFQLGNVTNATEQERAESVVLYTQGAKPDAVAVGRKLRISQTEPIDPSTQALAGDASVVVVVGNDRTD